MKKIKLSSEWGKILERVVQMELVKFLEDNNLRASQQHGFRKWRSTVTQLLEYYEKICKAIEDRTNLDTVYLDFAKAFDKADYGIAAHRIKELSIGGELSVWLVSFYPT